MNPPAVTLRDRASSSDHTYGMRIVPSLITACIINNTSLPAREKPFISASPQAASHPLVQVVTNAWTQMQTKIHLNGRFQQNSDGPISRQSGCGASQGDGDSRLSPFRASCTQLATENCHRSRAVCSDSSGTAQRRGNRASGSETRSGDNSKDKKLSAGDGGEIWEEDRVAGAAEWGSNGNRWRMEEEESGDRFEASAWRR